MSYDPYSAIIGQIVKGAARNMNESAASSKAAQKGGLGYGQAQEGMAYGQAPEMENTRESPSVMLTQIGTGGMVSPQMQKQMPIIKDAIKGEQAQLQNILPARGATATPATTYNPQDMYSQLYKSLYDRRTY